MTLHWHNAATFCTLPQLSKYFWWNTLLINIFSLNFLDGNYLEDSISCFLRHRQCAKIVKNGSTSTVAITNTMTVTRQEKGRGLFLQWNVNQNEWQLLNSAFMTLSQRICSRINIGIIQSPLSLPFIHALIHSSVHVTADGTTQAEQWTMRFSPTEQSD